MKKLYIITAFLHYKLIFPEKLNFPPNFRNFFEVVLFKILTVNSLLNARLYENNVLQLLKKELHISQIYFDYFKKMGLYYF
jgi:hypothetical protein